MKILAALSLNQLTLCCQLTVDNRDSCQAVCDNVTKCGAWSFEKSYNRCFLKDRYGWISVSNQKFDAGFKNQGPWYEEDMNFYGGDIDCNLINE